VALADGFDSRDGVAWNLEQHAVKQSRYLPDSLVGTDRLLKISVADVYL
jgi:hypothetical protein